jgi:hypothetical protein
MLYCDSKNLNSFAAPLHVQYFIYKMSLYDHETIRELLSWLQLQFPEASVLNLVDLLTVCGCSYILNNILQLGGPPYIRSRTPGVAAHSSIYNTSSHANRGILVGESGKLCIDFEDWKVLINLDCTLKIYCFPSINHFC